MIVRQFARVNLFFLRLAHKNKNDPWSNLVHEGHSWPCFLNVILISEIESLSRFSLTKNLQNSIVIYYFLIWSHEQSNTITSINVRKRNEPVRSIEQLSPSSGAEPSVRRGVVRPERGEQGLGYGAAERDSVETRVPAAVRRPRTRSNPPLTLGFELCEGGLEYTVFSRRLCSC